MLLPLLRKYRQSHEWQRTRELKYDFTQPFVLWSTQTVQLEQFLNIALPTDKEQFQNLAQCPTKITDAINSEKVSKLE